MTEKLKKFLKLIEPWHVLVTLIVLVVGGILGANAWVRSVAQDSVLEEKFLARLAEHVRPTCIFNSRGAIEANLGAEEYIEDVRVTPAPQVFGFEVVVRAKRHLAYAPLVAGLDVALFPQTVTRGRLHDWVIVLSPQNTAPNLWAHTGDEDSYTNTVYRFKLEILH